MIRTKIKNDNDRDEDRDDDRRFQFLFSKTSGGPGRRAGLIMRIETFECENTVNLKRYEYTSTCTSTGGQ